MDPDKRETDQADKIIRRAAQESHNIFTGALHRLGRMTGLSAEDDVSRSDPAEKWGRIIGRGLGFVFLIVLIVNLLTGWFF